MWETVPKSEVRLRSPLLSPHLTDGTVLVCSRFQKREYAPIDIVKTEKKGFGVRVREDLVA